MIENYKETAKPTEHAPQHANGFQLFEQDGVFTIEHVKTDRYPYGTFTDGHRAEKSFADFAKFPSAGVDDNG
jgi:hypothetical protein